MPARLVVDHDRGRDAFLAQLTALTDYVEASGTTSYWRRAGVEAGWSVTSSPMFI